MKMPQANLRALVAADVVAGAVHLDATSDEDKHVVATP